MRLLHTSDWHLGHSLHDLDRWREHDAFLTWLVTVLGQQNVDVLLITGDIFDSSNPPARATQRWFSFLAEVRQRYPDLDVIAIGGNHDSAGRLDAPQPVLSSLSIHIVGGLPRMPDGTIDVDKVLIPVTGAAGTVEGWVAAVPFLRPKDLPKRALADASPGRRLLTGMREVYQQITTQLHSRRSPGQAAVITGHCLMDGAMLSEHSERKIQGGNHDALPVDVFDDAMTYVALGHLHLAQPVGRETIRYAGSPIPLSMAEAGYQHEVRLIDIDGESVVEQKALYPPRTIDFLRIPDEGPADVDTVLSLIAALPARDPSVAEETLPLVELRVALAQAVPGLRRQLQQAMEDRAARMVKLSVTLTGSGDALADTVLVDRLRDIQPEEVFVRRYHRDHQGDVPQALLSSFHELLHAVSEEQSP